MKTFVSIIKSILMKTNLKLEYKHNLLLAVNRTKYRTTQQIASYFSWLYIKFYWYGRDLVVRDLIVSCKVLRDLGVMMSNSLNSEALIEHNLD